MFQSYDPMTKVYKEGDVVYFHEIGEAQVVRSTIEDIFARKYLLRFEDGTEGWFFASFFTSQLN